MVRTASRPETKRQRRWRMSVAGVTLRELIGYWEFHNRSENKSPDTIRWYNEALGLFERFLASKGRSRLIDIGEP